MKKILLIAVPVGVAVILAVVAQGYGFGRGFGGHHRGMAKDFIKWKMQQLGEELELNAAQKTKWDAFQQDLETQIDGRKDKRKEIHEAIRLELSKENPDLNKVTPLIHGQIDEMSQFGHELVNRIGELYADLNPEQKRKVAETLERFHDRHDE